MSQKSTNFREEREKSFCRWSSSAGDGKIRRLSELFHFLRLKLVSIELKCLSTEPNHWTLCLNCLIEFSVAAKLKICFYIIRKKFDVSVLSDYTSANRWWYLAHFTRFSDFPLSLFRSPAFQRELSTGRQEVFVPLIWKFLTIYVGLRHRIIDFPRLVSFPSRRNPRCGKAY